MTRTHDDTWDLASSVGATATMVAAARAIATSTDGALISDPYAEPLVRAVGVDVFTRLASGELHPSAFDDDENVGMDRMVDNMAVRTKFFDDFFTDATAAGIRQVVILAFACQLQEPPVALLHRVLPGEIRLDDALDRRPPGGVGDRRLQACRRCVGLFRCGLNFANRTRPG